MPSNPPKRLPEALLITLLFTGFFFFCLRPVEDHDVWWHLATGRYILQHHVIPRHDIFSWTCSGKPWINTYWLYDSLIYRLYTLGGIIGIILYKALIAALIFLPVYRRLRLHGMTTEWTLAGTWLAFWGSRLSQTGWGERASLVNYLGVSFLLWHLEEVQRGRWPRRSLWIWPAAFALWVNLHQGFLVGMGLVGLYAVGIEAASSETSRFYFKWALACAAATLLTPYGTHLYPMLITIATTTLGISEWQRPGWEHMAIYWMVLAAFWVSWIAQKQRKKSVSLGFFLIACSLSYGSLRHILHVPFFVIFATPWVIEAVSGFAYLNRQLPAVWIRPVVLSLLTLFAANAALGIRGGVDRRRFPVDACRFIDRTNPPGPFYNAYPFGGYWIWHFGERRPVFIDGRNPTVEGYEALWEAILKAQGNSPAEWQAFLTKWGVRAVLLDHPEWSVSGSIYAAYFPASSWDLAYRDPAAVIYIKRGTAAAKASPVHAR